VAPPVSASLDNHYGDLQARWTTVDRQADYARLVVPGGNALEPLHRWFHQKEAYSAQLLPRLFKDADYEPHGRLAVLDPYSGSGTSVLSALDFGREVGVQVRALGIEFNPLIKTIASAKVGAALRGSALATTIRYMMPSLEADYRCTLRRPCDLETASPTLNNRAYFPPEHVRALRALAISAEKIPDHDARAVLQACVATAVEPAGRLRRDGRALRYTPDRLPVHPWESFTAALARCLEDIGERKPARRGTRATIALGDGRRPDLLAAPRQFDWILFSPPYPNNIDYTEVYKTEAWALGMYQDADDMRRQRLGTVRSHPSLKFPDEYYYEASTISATIDEVLDPLLRCVPNDRYRIGRWQVIRGFADDMFRTLEAARRLVKNGGHLVYVVGNSVHGTPGHRFVIAADLIMARLAELSGWQVEEIRVARYLRRRAEDNPYLRESVVALRPQ
jgi:hypothetical protein